jgi:hypothetical protein
MPYRRPARLRDRSSTAARPLGRAFARRACVMTRTAVAIAIATAATNACHGFGTRRPSDPLAALVRSSSARDASRTCVEMYAGSRCEPRQRWVRRPTTYAASAKISARILVRTRMMVSSDNPTALCDRVRKDSVLVVEPLAFLAHCSTRVSPRRNGAARRNQQSRRSPTGGCRRRRRVATSRELRSRRRSAPRTGGPQCTCGPRLGPRPALARVR